MTALVIPPTEISSPFSSFWDEYLFIESAVIFIEVRRVPRYIGRVERRRDQCGACGARHLEAWDDEDDPIQPTDILGFNTLHDAVERMLKHVCWEPYKGHWRRAPLRKPRERGIGKYLSGLEQKALLDVEFRLKRAHPLTIRSLIRRGLMAEEGRELTPAGEQKADELHRAKEAW
jgi:hypothetical protein